MTMLNKQGQLKPALTAAHTHTRTHTNIYQYTKSKHVNEIYG